MITIHQVILATSASIALFTWVPPLQAHLPAAYGREYLRADTVDAATVPAGQPATVVGVAIDPAAYRAAVRDLELDHGPYAPGLTEPLNALARHHAALGEWQRAIALYDRAIYIERVNGGLDSERLLPLLREQAALYRSLGDPAGLDRARKQLYRVHSAGEPPYTPVRLRAALEYFAWQREAIALADGRNVEARLVELLEENRRLLANHGQDPASDSAWQLKLLLSQLDNFYVLRGMDPDIASASHDDASAARQRLETWQRGVLGRGVALITGYLERWPDSPALARARLRLELGDWYQWNDKWRSARDIYVQLWHWMRDEDLTSQRDRWLSQPVELPQGRLFGVHQPSSSGPVTLQFDVSATGRVHQARLLKGAEEPGYQIRRLVKDSHFRPAFRNGKAVTTRELVRTYVLLE